MKKSIIIFFTSIFFLIAIFLLSTFFFKKEGVTLYQKAALGDIAFEYRTNENLITETIIIPFDRTVGNYLKFENSLASSPGERLPDETYAELIMDIRVSLFFTEHGESAEIINEEDITINGVNAKKTTLSMSKAPLGRFICQYYAFVYKNYCYFITYSAQEHRVEAFQEEVDQIINSITFT